DCRDSTSKIVRGLDIDVDTKCQTIFCFYFVHDTKTPDLMLRSARQHTSPGGKGVKYIIPLICAIPLFITFQVTVETCAQVSGNLRGRSSKPIRKYTI
ncbi:MAG: hypothetical protein ACXW3U_16830, partial [Rhodoplanes sp.]